MTNKIRELNWKQRNVVDLMGEVIVKINQIVRFVNRLEDRVNAMQKDKDGSV